MHEIHNFIVLRIKGFIQNINKNKIKLTLKLRLYSFILQKTPINKNFNYK